MGCWHCADGMLLSCWEREAPALWVSGVQVERPLPIPLLPCPEHCPSLSPTLSPAPPEAETMASKPEKRVASSVLITLVPPRRDEAVVEEVRRAACRPGLAALGISCPHEGTPGAGSVGKPGSGCPWQGLQPQGQLFHLSSPMECKRVGGQWTREMGSEAALKWGAKSRLSGHLLSTIVFQADS